MILETLRSVVIVGIFSSVVDSLLMEQGDKVPSHLRFLGYVNTTIADIEKYELDLCTKNGGPTAYDDHKRSWDNLSDCISFLIDTANVEAYSIAGSTQSSQLIRSTTKAYCRHIPDFLNCFKNETESMKTCLDPEKHESVNIIYNSLSSVMGFLCEDEGTRVIDFMNADGYFCLLWDWIALQECANQTIFEYVRATVPNGAAIGRIGALHLLLPNSEKCTLVENFQHCAVESLKSCEHPVPVNFVNSIFNVVKKVTTCEHLLKSQASPIGVANVLLMTAATAMSLQFSRT